MFGSNWLLPYVCYYALCIAANASFSNAFVVNVPSSFIRCVKPVTSHYQLHSATLPSVGSPQTEELSDVHDERSARTDVEVKFSHVHFYTDNIDDISVYKDLEHNLNSFANGNELDEMHLNLSHFQETWQKQHADADDDQDSRGDFVPQNRDIIKQLLAGLGFRITAMSHTRGTKNVLLTTKDLDGVKFVVSALDTCSESSTNGIIADNNEGVNDGHFSHFESGQIQQFYDEHAGRQGIAVLAFEVTDGDIDSLFQRYQALHPDLITADFESGAVKYEEDGTETKILEVYSYYKNEKGGEVDLGTKLRFVQRANAEQILPGLTPLEASFDKTCMPAYCDHWVSNVVSRTGFLDTLEETLGFTPKVDFNAGVVAAGEAQIESTVTGNDSTFETNIKDEALVDQSQVYLPINNALNEFSHVHGFLDEVGQGVQHVASRVDDLPQFIQRGNDFRKITGEGFTFLQIPRSYYGVLTAKLLKDSVGLSNGCAEIILGCCESSRCMTKGLEGAVDLQLTRDELKKRLDSSMPMGHHHREEFEVNVQNVVDTILRSRYINMYNLLGDILSEETYLSIVRNQILVDVQGRDILYQIFTSNILQRKAGDESPFLEFIQRVCADCSDDGCPLGMKAGCGGFGIRNFLTLFLSIEIGKAMLDVSHAKSSNDTNTMRFAQLKVDAFTDQLNESNPILTAISDAMTEEGVALERMQVALKRGDDADAAEWEERMKQAEEMKHASNVNLMELNSKYNELMKSLRLDSEPNA